MLRVDLIERALKLGPEILLDLYKFIKEAIFILEQLLVHTLEIISLDRIGYGVLPLWIDFLVLELLFVFLQLFCKALV